MTVTIKSEKPMGDHIMKYSDIVQESYGEHIGSITVLGQEMQLCDHMQNIDNRYYATSFILNVKNRIVLKEAGVRFGTLSDGSHAIYLTEELLAIAKPLRENDEMTQAMINRMITGLSSANLKKHSQYA